MAANINEIDVTITLESQAITRQGFGIGLIVGTTKHFIERARSYASTSEMTDDGFVSTDAEYIAASAYFAPSPRALSVVIGRRTVDQAVLTITTVVLNTDYTTTINGTDFIFNSGATPTAEAIAAGLVAAINLGSEPVTATDNLDGTYDLDADVAGVAWTLEVDSNQTISPYVPTDTIADDMDAILNYTTTGGIVSWYAVCELLHDPAEVIQLASWAETNKKLYFSSSSDTDIITVPASTDTTSVAALIAAASYTYSNVMYHSDDLSYPEATFMGTGLPYDPGTINWAYLTLSGVAYVLLTDTERQNALDKRANIYVQRYGRSITEFGTVGDVVYGYIDVRRTVDWLQARIAENLFSLLASALKVPYTNQGIEQVKSNVLNTLNIGVETDAIAATPVPTVTAPKAFDVDPVDKAARLLPDVDFTCTLSGAINNIKVNGYVRV